MLIVNNILKKKSLRLLTSLLLQLATFPLYLLGYCLPKKDNLWIFGNHLGDKDNSFYLYQYIKANHPAINAIWISKNEKNIKSKYPNAYYYLSIAGLYYQYFASVSVHTTGLGDFAKFCRAKKFRVQLWHGIPIKKILLDSPETLPFPNDKGMITGLLRAFIQKQVKETYHLTIASSEYIQEILMTAFNQTRDQVIITGYPRQDIISSRKNETNIKKNILYAPTWRPDDKQLLDIVSGGILAIKDHFTQDSYCITISLHPLNSALFSQLSQLENIYVYSGDDINKDLVNYDMLVTDYSSIAIDFLPLQKEIRFYTPDYKQYCAERGIYPEFTQLIKNCELGVITDDPPIDIERYFKFNDQKACERITQAIINTRSTQL